MTQAEFIARVKQLPVTLIDDRYGSSGWRCGNALAWFRNDSYEALLLRLEKFAAEHKDDPPIRGFVAPGGQFIPATKETGDGTSDKTAD